jgi:hypothetical protein
LVLLGVTVAGHQAGPDDPPGDASKTRTPATSNAPIYFLVDQPLDLSALLDRLTRPDFVLLRGSNFEAMRRPSPLRPDPGDTDTIESVVVGGQVSGDVAKLEMDLVVLSEEDRPAHWSRIGLSDIVLTELRLGDQELPVRFDQVAGWQARLPRGTRHVLRIAARAGIPARADGPRLSFGIPEAASTRVDLLVAGKLTEALAGGDVLGIAPSEDGQSSRAFGTITPRGRLDFSWKSAAPESRTELKPVLTAQGEIELDVGRGMIRARSVWSVRCERGSVSSLRFRLDRADELVGLELESRPIPGDIPREAETGALTIPLAEPLSQGQSVRVSISTRRSIPAGDSIQTVFRGLPLEGAMAQSGILVVAQASPDVWVSGAPGRGLRAIDSRGEPLLLPRARPSLLLSYQFVENPFELELRIDPTPASARVETRSTVRLEGSTARLDSWLDYQVGRGRISEVRVTLPESLQLESAGPDSVVASHTTFTDPAAGGLRLLVLSLSETARAAGSFLIHLTTRQAVGAIGPAEVALPQPRDARLGSATLAVFADPGEIIELGPTTAGTLFDRLTSAPAGDWPRPADQPDETPRLWLGLRGAASVIPLVRTREPLALYEETRAEAMFDLNRLEVRQITELILDSGVLEQVEILVPAELDARFEVESSQSMRRTRLDSTEGGTRYRLGLSRPVTDRLRLQMRFGNVIRVSSTPGSFQIPIVQVQKPDLAGRGFTVSARGSASIELSPTGSGWRIADGSGTAGAALANGPRHYEWTESRTAPLAGVSISAVAQTAAPLPELVVSRSLFRSRVSGGVVHTTAMFRVERHLGRLEFRLPPQSRLIGASLSNKPIPDIEHEPSENRYLVRLPESPLGATVVEVRYQSSARQGWGPTLGPGCVIENALWEIRTPSNQVLVGEPSSWVDANSWHWDFYVWKRRPRYSGDRLLSWIAGGSEPSETSEILEAGDQTYLFSSAGAAPSSIPWIVARPALVAVCSGLALVGGLALVLGWIRSTKAIVAVLLGSLIAGTFLPASVISLLVQSSAIGVVLALFGWLVHWVVERRRRRARPSGEPSAVRGGSGLILTPSSREEPFAVGSDESTVVRSRSASDGPARGAGAGSGSTPTVGAAQT